MMPPLQKTVPHLRRLLHCHWTMDRFLFRRFSTAQAIADELLKPDDTPEGPLQERLNVLRPNLNHEIFVEALNLSNEAGRKVLGFYEWSAKRPGFLNESSFAAVIDFFGRRKDFKAIRAVLLQRSLRRFPVGEVTFKVVAHRMARAGRPTQLIAFFNEMDELRFEINRLDALSIVGHAESLVKKLADRFFPSEAMCETLIKGWCDAGKLEEARRLAGEVVRGGFSLSVGTYNAILDCVCKLCRRKDPFRLTQEANVVLVEMEAAGIPRNSATFGVLISNLCKIRKTQEALELFRRMPEWSCSPDSDTFIVLARSLYLAARVEEGDEMVSAMKSAGFCLTIKDHFKLIRTLCGIERVEHAMKVFARIKEDGFQLETPTFELLIEKLISHGKVEEAKLLYQEATERGLTIAPQEYKINPRFAKKDQTPKKKAKRETLPMKMERKRKQLRKLWLSFVKKPKKGMQRAY